MKLEGEHVFKGPREEVYMMFRDPDVLASALPGTQTLNKIDDQHYEGNINIRIGPVSGSFAGKLEVTDEVPPEKCTLMVDGKGAPGFARGLAQIEFVDQGDGTTLLKYAGDMTIGGTLASVGQRMLDSVAKSMIRQGMETLDKALEARLAAKAAGKTEVEFKAPTETQFAGAVAKDWFGGLMKVPEFKMVLYIVPVGLLVFLLSLVLSQCTR